MKLDLYKINAFTNRYNGGNPAGVIPLKKWLPDDLMQAIATENGFSETAFFVPENDQFKLRWFTPGCEVNLCGHATLATVFVIANELGIEFEKYIFHTRSGELSVRRVKNNKNAFTLNFPVNKLQPSDCPDMIASGLNIKTDNTLLECYKADDYLLVLSSQSDVAALTPDFSQLRRMDARGLIVTAPADDADIDFVSRWFGGPDVNVDEDPVTGSAHCSLVPYWADRLQKNTLNARQISTRQGNLSCQLMDGRVYMTGDAVMYFKGEITNVVEE